MKRAELLARLRVMAERDDVEFLFRRHGGRHDVYWYGRTTLAIPRHRELDEMTARAIFRDCERTGKDGS